MQDHSRPEECPNCGTKWIESAEFCYHCGQDKHSYRKSFGHLILEFFETLLHFDTKSLMTFRTMFTRPGKITVDFLDGKRARYVPPFRLYIFLSVIYFFLLAALSGTDSDGPVKFNRTIEQDSTANDGQWNIKVNGQDKVVLGSRDEAIDSMANIKPKDKFEAMLVRMFSKMGSASADEVSDSMISMFSKILFLLLPLFALLLKLLYIRRKRLYFDHLIFSIHFHTLAIFLLLVMLLLEWIFPRLSLDVVVILLMFVYLFLGMKRMYGQSWGKTLLKFGALVAVYTVFMGMAMVAALLLGLSQIH